MKLQTQKTFVFYSTYIQLDDCCADRWIVLGDKNSISRKMFVKCAIAILLESKLLDNKEQPRLQMLYQLYQEDIMTEIESYSNNEINNDITNSTK